MTTDPTHSAHVLPLLLGALLLTLGGGALLFLRLFGVFDSDWVAYLGFALCVVSWFVTRQLKRSGAIEGRSSGSE